MQTCRDAGVKKIKRWINRGAENNPCRARPTLLLSSTHRDRRAAFCRYFLSGPQGSCDRQAKGNSATSTSQSQSSVSVIVLYNFNLCCRAMPPPNTAPSTFTRECETERRREKWQWPGPGRLLKNCCFCTWRVHGIRKGPVPFFHTALGNKESQTLFLYYA